MTEPPAAVRAAEPPPDPSPAPGRITNRPPGYPNALVWLRAGILRDWRGVLGAFVATWFYLPVALFAAVWGGVLGAFVSVFAGALGTEDQLPAAIRDTPLVGDLLDAVLSRSGGVLGGFVGFALGAVGGFLIVVLLPWREVLDEPFALLAGLLGTTVAAALIGLLYTIYRVLLEPRLMVVSGARELSRREQARLLPILEDCARRLGLPTVPRLLIEDGAVLTNARTYTRHIVITSSVLDEPDEEIAALFSHELVHWRTGDEVTSAFVRGVALPLTLAHALPTWLMRTFPHTGTKFVVFLIFWPILLTMRYVVLPLHAQDVRAAEYRADLGAVFTGHVEGLRSVLERRRSFEGGRSGWDEAVCATHPPHELRLDRLDRTTEQPAVAPVPLTTETLFGRPGDFGTPRSWLVAGLVVAALVVGTAGLGVVQWAFFRPQSAVDGYFDALADRDADAALDLLDPGAVPTADRELLADLIRGDGYEPPTDVEITAIEREEETATATISFRLAGTEQQAELRLHRAESATAGLFHGWRLQDGLATVGLPPGRDGLTVNGVPIPSPSEDSPPISLLPGVHTASAPGSALSEVPTEKIVLVPGQTTGAAFALAPVLRPEVTATAQERVRAYLDECAKQTVAAPTGCPFDHSGGTVQKISWEILEYPEVVVNLLGPDTARVSTPAEGQGRVRATGTETYFGGPSPFDDEDQVAVVGLLTASGDTLTFQPGNGDD
ncbi:M48 family metalloprotease [Micromonospora musae]|uniref:Peptidase M48 domain-containing protein n=1 Tax=Micromonospora musae TaxID=1894970 RepID=A0A3A9YBC6_9ACTN|nr:M48 family metalloprotease [Micromonospora musae]RKN34568.1 hypothetical protein D7044_06990 [Micromonospora musae]